MATSGSGSKLLKEVEITEERSGYSSPSRHQTEKNRHGAGRKLKEKEHLTVFVKKYIIINCSHSCSVQERRRWGEALD